MAVDYFLKIDGIEGESLDSKHKGEIDVMSFSFGATNPGSLATGGGAGAGRVQFSGFHFTKGTDKASPKLFLACASGKHINSAVLVGRKAGENAFEFYKLTLSDVLVSSYQTGASNGESPQESVSLNFAKIEIEYTQQSQTGAAGQVTSAGWDLKQNKAL